MKLEIAVVSWVVSGASLSSAAALAAPGTIAALLAADGVMTPEQAAAALTTLNDLMSATADGGLTWKDVAVWFAGLNGLLWNPWVQRVLHLITDVGERALHAHEAPANSPVEDRATLPIPPSADAARRANIARFAAGGQDTRTNHEL